MFQKDFKPICVGDLINTTNQYKFIIPSFQRGYRWEEKQVIDLLEDLNRFVNGDQNQGNIYYLQPLILCKKEHTSNDWYVLDGQQRLTTMCLVLLNLKSYGASYMMNDINNGIYAIEYESRAAIDFNNPNRDIDINNFYVAKANATIQKWINDFITNDPNGQQYLSKIMEALFNKTPAANSQNNTANMKFVKFIWFDISDGNVLDVAKEIEIYNRFNSNKIKLTPSELIKALFVLESKTNNSLDISSFLNDWNTIEKQFQDNKFWHLFSSSDLQTRIDYLFNTLVGNISNDEKDFDKSYRYFQSKYDQNTSLKDDWDLAKDCFNIFVQCYEDPILNNYIGLLIYLGEKTENIIGIIKDSSKDYETKLKDLRKKIKTKLFGRRTADFNDISQLTYDDDYDLVKKVLLTYNVETCNIQKIKFDFDCFYDEKWEIEHVDSQNKTFTSNSAIQEWLENVKSALHLFPNDRSNQDLIAQCDVFLSSLENDTFNKSSFDGFVPTIDDFFAEKDSNTGNPVRLGDEEKQRIWNLALLDKTTNIGFSNSPFPAKRQYLIQHRLETGKFVPICTERLFLKYYAFSSTTGPINLDLLHWTRDDRRHYLDDIQDKLKGYLN